MAVALFLSGGLSDKVDLTVLPLNDGTSIFLNAPGPRPSPPPRPEDARAVSPGPGRGPARPGRGAADSSRLPLPPRRRRRLQPRHRRRARVALAAHVPEPPAARPRRLTRPRRRDLAIDRERRGRATPPHAACFFSRNSRITSISGSRSAGRRLSLEFPGAGPQVRRVVRARVMHCTAQGDETWLVGCRFDSPLADHELRELASQVD